MSGKIYLKKIMKKQRMLAMPTNKQQLVRIMTLVSMMKENRYPNRAALQRKMQMQGRDTERLDKYSITQKTVQRDVAYLKKQYNAPIRYNRTKNGYYLTNPDWSFDVPMLDDNEMKAVVIGARLAESLMPPPLSGEIREGANTLLGPNTKGLDETACLLSLVATGSRVPLNPDIFQKVFKAWQGQHSLSIVYKKAMESGTQEFLIEPHVLVFHDGLWYLKSIILESNGQINPERTVRTLALHRIEDACVHAGKFEPDEALIAEVNAGNVFNFQTVPEARLLFSGNAISFARENYPAESITLEPDGRLIVTVKNAIEFKLINLVLNENGAVQIIFPTDLAKKVIAQAEQVISQQRKFL